MVPDIRQAQRIMVYGFSSSGKSTLSEKLGRELDLPVVHLDRLHFVPNTNWEPVPWDLFVERHQDAVQQDRWIIEGSYSKTMDHRAARADTILHVDQNRFGCLYRFIKRYFNQKNGREKRTGTPDGLREKFNWDMVWWILEPRSLSPRRRTSHLLQKRVFRDHADKVIHLRNFKEIDALVDQLRSSC